MTSPSKDTVRVEHTPTPWATNIALLSDDSVNVAHVIAANGNMVAQVANYSDGHCRELTALIVRAVNRDHHFNDLVKALEEARGDTKKLSRELQQGMSKQNAAQCLLALSSSIDATLSRIKTEG